MTRASKTPLTALAHGGGCGCKLSPAVLRELLVDMPAMRAFPDLLVGVETGDDAAVYRISDDQAVVATTNFFMPIVDDPFDFGRIAAANALSDVYAMGGTPIMALAILGVPLGKLGPEDVRAILAGGASICAEAGIPVAGGHSIDAPEPIYGLVVIGLVHPDRILRNTGAQPDDVLFLSKPLGVGVISAALKSGALDLEARSSAYDALLGSTTQLNTIGRDLAKLDAVHAVTDVTGFGLLGHGLEICRGSSLTAHITASEMPLLDGVESLARTPYRTGAAVRNWDSYRDDVVLDGKIGDWQRDVLCDPQTSGGLLVAVEAESAGQVLSMMNEAEFAQASKIGFLKAGPPQI